LDPRPQTYQCPQCKSEFSLRRKKCCRECGILLLIPTDNMSDQELTAIRSFRMWDPVNERWKFIQDWEEHKRKAKAKLDAYLSNVLFAATT
jgi:hypothetical protein